MSERLWLWVKVMGRCLLLYTLFFYLGIRLYVVTRNESLLEVFSLFTQITSSFICLSLIALLFPKVEDVVLRVMQFVLFVNNKKRS